MRLPCVLHGNRITGNKDLGEVGVVPPHISRFVLTQTLALGSRRNRVSVRWRNGAKFSAACAVRTHLSSSRNATSSTPCSPFSIPQCGPDRGTDPDRIGGQAGQVIPGVARGGVTDPALPGHGGDTA